MRILFDHGTPAPLRAFLKDHIVQKARDAGWDTLANGDLIKAAEAAGFELLITTDKNIAYQQNLKDRGIAILVLGIGQWPDLRSHVDDVVAAIKAVTPGSYTYVEITGE